MPAKVKALPKIDRGLQAAIALLRFPDDPARPLFGPEADGPEPGVPVGEENGALVRLRPPHKGGVRDEPLRIVRHKRGDLSPLFVQIAHQLA